MNKFIKDGEQGGWNAIRRFKIKDENTDLLNDKVDLVGIAPPAAEAKGAGQKYQGRYGPHTLYEDGDGGVFVTMKTFPGIAHLNQQSGEWRLYPLAPYEGKNCKAGKEAECKAATDSNLPFFKYNRDSTEFRFQAGAPAVFYVTGDPATRSHIWFQSLTTGELGYFAPPKVDDTPTDPSKGPPHPREVRVCALSVPEKLQDKTAGDTHNPKPGGIVVSNQGNAYVALYNTNGLLARVEAPMRRKVEGNEPGAVRRGYYENCRVQWQQVVTKCAVTGKPLPPQAFLHIEVPNKYSWDETQPTDLFLGASTNAFGYKVLGYKKDAGGIRAEGNSGNRQLDALVILKQFNEVSPLKVSRAVIYYEISP